MLSISPSFAMSVSFEKLRDAKLQPVSGGAICGPDIKAETLWSNAPALIFVVRRPGCILCREHAQDITSRFADGQFPTVRLMGIIKEVAPVPGAETDDLLGVEEFHTKYFRNHPLYVDQSKTFFEFLGNKSLLRQSFHSWNPFTLYADFVNMNQRLKSKKVEGNLKGEGLLKGGILVVSPKKGIIYKYEEMTGSEMPYNDIFAAVREAENS